MPRHHHESLPSEPPASAAPRARAEDNDAPSPISDRHPRPPPVAPSVVTFRLGEAQFAVLSVPLHDSRALAGLTEAERQVATLAAAGLSNASIARCRRTSSRTVANQMASILRKLGVGSRYGLAARLAQCPVAAGGRYES
ncbi:MAG TPA: helix-turn-helix transcriptional regulator [Polyangiaceae bacterium]|nr:helix-turn-helix transcriptional regulator [Polyangiaceae bacterium]